MRGDLRQAGYVDVVEEVFGGFWMVEFDAEDWGGEETEVQVSRDSWAGEEAK